MASTGSLYSQTLQDITTTKLGELNKRRQSFEYYRQRCDALVHKDDDVTGALVATSDIIKACFNITLSKAKWY